MGDNGEKIPLILAFIGDLMITIKIEGVARHLGYEVIFMGDAAELEDPTGSSENQRPGEPIDGPNAILITQLTTWQPSLLIFDLSNDQIPWREWIRLVKSSPATRRIPILCFGPHVDVDAIHEAKNLSSEAIPRSRFMSTMADVLKQNIRLTNYGAINTACDAAMSDNAYEGLLAFNAGQYFDAHELLEEAWNQDSGPAREAYRGVLQIAVAYMQIERGNYRGATKMFLRARQWLDPLPHICRGIDIQRLREDAERAFSSLNALGADSIGEFDARFLKPVQFSRPANGNETRDD